MGNMVTQLTITQLCSSFPAFIKTCVYNHIHKSQLDTTLSQSNNRPYLHIILHKAKFYYFLPPILFVSPGWLLSFHFSGQHNICIFLSLITLTCGAEYKLWSPFFPIFISLLLHLFKGEITYLVLHSQLPIYLLPIKCNTKLQAWKLVFSHVSTDGYLGLTIIQAR